MELTFYGAAGLVTGSCYLLKVGNKKILIDCGEFQERKDISKLNYENFIFNPKDIDCVLLTHAHIDHCGLLPKLYKKGFRGKIYSTTATKDLCDIMLLDAARIHEEETKNDNERLEEQHMPLRQPLFTMQDAKLVMKLFKPFTYDQRFSVTDSVFAIFRDAGHILGSASIEVFASEKGKAKKIVFSGDIGQKDSPIVKDPTYIKDADIVLIESTYGSRNHEESQQRKEMLYAVMKHAFQKRGPLIIPSFAVERTQELLYYLNEFSNHRLLPQMTFYVDSPLANKATEIFKKHKECFDDEAREVLKTDSDPFMFDELSYVSSKPDSMALNFKKGPFCIIAGSGMCNGGRIKYHLKHHLSDPKTTILFVGFQANGTLGRHIRDGDSEVLINGKPIEVNAEVVSIAGFSAHAGQSGLVEWAKSFKNSKPKKPIFFIVHGEPIESKGLKRKLDDLGFKTIIPNLYDTAKF
jgi:metallo-beta-lactamase family protein